MSGCEKEKPNYYAIIPAVVRYDEDLTPNAKLLYGEITALSNAEGYCWSSNSYFANLYGVSVKTISRTISQLEEKGYITRVIILNEENEVVKRKLYINTPVPDEREEKAPGGMDKNAQGVWTEMSRGYRQKCLGGIDKNVQDNNTSINNTSINTLSSTPDKIGAMDEVIDKWNSIGLNQIRTINANTNRYKMLSARLKEYSLDDILEALENVADSDFLKGQNQRGWTATFDWVIKPNNFIKVLEDNYSNTNNKTITQTNTTFHNFNQAGDKYTNAELEAIWAKK